MGFAGGPWWSLGRSIVGGIVATVGASMAWWGINSKVHKDNKRARS